MTNNQQNLVIHIFGSVKKLNC